MSERKKIAFFGDSYVARWPGSWIEYICDKNNYEQVHLGKLGADPFYVFESWEKFNDSGETADICVYAHTEPGRMYHPDRDIPLTIGCVDAAIRKEFKMNLSEEALNAALAFKLHLDFPQEYNMKARIIPRGIDRIIAEKNKAFNKIIHIWSFAPIRANKELHDSPADSEWGFEMHSGVNIMLDLSNLTRVEPGYPAGGFNNFDPRVCHFSSEAFEFLNDMITFAASVPNGTQLGPSKILDRHSTWNDYINAWEQIKKEYNENLNSR